MKIVHATRLLTPALALAMLAASPAWGQPASASARRKQAGATIAVPVAEFLNSIGVNSTFPDRGQPLPRTIEMLKYTGFRWVRGGIEGLSAQGPTTIGTYLQLHRQTGVRFSWGLVSGGTDLEKLITTARQLASAGALLAFEGNNEPNNWGVTYQGEKGGGSAPSWMAVAKLQHDLYRAVKSDPILKAYPVWSISEGGARRDNVGLQFLTIPPGSGTKMPPGTTYADFANVHNYIYHPNSSGIEDNKSWNAAEPTAACRVDGLFGNYGVTWAQHFRGYSEKALLTLPRVTTETGCTIDGPVTEEIHALNLMNLYLAQFAAAGSTQRCTCCVTVRTRAATRSSGSSSRTTPRARPRYTCIVSPPSSRTGTRLMSRASSPTRFPPGRRRCMTSCSRRATATSTSSSGENGSKARTG